MREFLIWLLGCHQHRLTWPMTVGGRTYRTCTSCGREIEVNRNLVELTRAEVRSAMAPRPPVRPARQHAIFHHHRSPAL